MRAIFLPNDFFARMISREDRRGGNSLYFVWCRHAIGIVPIFQVIYTSVDHDFISDIHLQPFIQSPAVLNPTT